MNKIKTKIIFVFCIFILILAVEVVFNKLSVNSVDDSYANITEQLEPSLRYLNELNALNAELLLLTKYKLSIKGDIEISNRIKTIIEVDYPNLKTELFLLSENMSTDDEKRKLFTELSNQIDRSIEIVNYFNVTLISVDYFKDSVKTNQARKLINEDLSKVNFLIKNNIIDLTNQYTKTYSQERKSLLSSLNSASIIILITGLLAILYAIFVAYRLIQSIVVPVQKLEQAAQQIKEGNYVTTDIEGSDEFVSLGRSFNEMSYSLDSNFKQLEQNNIELEQFVYITSHDLQEPLRTIKSFSNLLLKNDTSQFDEKTKKSLFFITQAATRMSNLVHALLEYGRMGIDIKLERIKPKEVIKIVLQDLKLKTEENEAKITFNKSPEILGYKKEFRVLLQNLIENAIKYKSPDRKPLIKITASENNEYWTFKVRDNGIGIEEKQYDKVFQMFQRLHSQREIMGTGIGLAKCRKIVALHEGTIWIESEIGKGSNFIFTIRKPRLDKFKEL